MLLTVVNERVTPLHHVDACMEIQLGWIAWLHSQGAGLRAC